MSHSMSSDHKARDGEGHGAAQPTLAGDGSVHVSNEEIGPNRHRIVATATFDQPVTRIWAAVRDFEKLVALALPGVASDFEWLHGGGPDRVPSRFQFVANGAHIIEELYERNDGEHVLRYRVLEPAFGILEYDAELRFVASSDGQTKYSSFREATLEPGALEALAGLIALETQNMKNHFAKRP